MARLFEVYWAAKDSPLEGFPNDRVEGLLLLDAHHERAHLEGHEELHLLDWVLLLCGGLEEEWSVTLGSSHAL